MPLWVYLDVWDSTTPKEEDNQIKNILTHFKRAGSLPVSLDIYQMMRYDSQLPQREHIWKPLLKNVARWGRVSIFCPFEIYETLQKNADGGKKFLQLTDLNFELDDWWRVGPEEGPLRIDAFAQAPKLRKVAFQTRTSQRGSKVMLVLPWHQLEQYCSQGYGDDALDNILQANPKNLVYLNYVVATFHTHPPKHPLIMPKLQVLRAQACENAGQLAALLDQLVLPSLVELQLRGRFTQEDRLFTKVKNLVARSSCSLRTMELDDGDTDINTFTQLLSLTPMLESLDITRPPDTMLATLILDPSSPDPVLPKLSKLTIEVSANNTIRISQLEEGQRIYTCDVQVLRAVLGSRMCAIEPPLGSFHEAEYFKTLTQFRFGFRGDYPDVTVVWNLQAELEGPSTVPGFPDERLREWQMWFKTRFTMSSFGMDLYNPKLQLGMHLFLRQVEKLEPNSEILRLFTVSVKSLFQNV